MEQRQRPCGLSLAPPCAMAQHNAGAAIERLAREPAFGAGVALAQDLPAVFAPLRLVRDERPVYASQYRVMSGGPMVCCISNEVHWVRPGAQLPFPSRAGALHCRCREAHCEGLGAIRVAFGQV
jgi:hypothetical protein